MAGCDGFECGFEPGAAVDAVRLGCLNEQSDASPCRRAFVVTRERRILSRQGKRPGEILDIVADHLDAVAGEENPEGVPVAGDAGETSALVAGFDDLAMTGSQ